MISLSVVCSLMGCLRVIYSKLEMNHLSLFYSCGSEETGIQCQFLSVLGVRHTHGTQFGRSDLFFVCRLEPIPNQDGKMPEPIPQEGEIEVASWLPLDEYRNMVSSDDSKIGHPMMIQVMKIVDQGDGKETDIQRMIVPSVVPGRKRSPLYHAPILSNADPSS